MIVNFALVSDLQSLLRWDYPVADRTIIDPNSVNPLIDGEFLFVNTASQAIRGADGSIGFACFSERGRFDVQSVGKVTVLGGQTYYADTRVFTSAGITLGGKLQLSASVSLDGKTKSGLANYASGEVIGYVMRRPQENGGKLRFIQTLV